MNAAGSDFVCCVSAPPTLSAATGYQHADRSVAALLACLPAGASSAEGAALWARVTAAAAPVVKKAYAHVTGCKCDVAGAAAVAMAAGRG